LLPYSWPKLPLVFNLITLDYNNYGRNFVKGVKVITCRVNGAVK